MKKLGPAYISVAFVTVLSIAAPLASAQTSKPSKSVENMVKSAIRDGLKDPASAQFTEMYTFMSGGSRHTCGYVNAKNSFGGYTGKKPFFVRSIDSEIKTIATEGSGNGAMALINSMCDPVEVGRLAAVRSAAEAKDREAEKMAICQKNTTASTEGQCGEWHRKCEIKFKGLTPDEFKEYMNLCRRSGYDAAAEKWQSTMGKTITFGND